MITRISSNNEAAVLNALNIIRKYKEQNGFKALLDLLARENMHKNQSTIFRWLRHENVAPRRKSTQNRVLAVARLIEAEQATHNIVTFGIIPGASELLPALVLNDISALKNKFLLIEKRSVDECFSALEKGEVDVIIASRRSGDRYPSDDSDSQSQVRRICRLVTVQADGFFPGWHQSRDFLARALHEEHKTKPLTIGCLRNARYDLLLHKLMIDYDDRLLTRPIKNSTEAIRLICKGEIRGVVGHSVFVTNVLNGIKKKVAEKRRLKSGRKALLSKLNFCRAPRDSFLQIKMDLFINLKYFTGLRIYTALEMLKQANNYINSNRTDVRFCESVCKKLGLASKKIGKDVLNEFQFEMETFETDVLLKIWRELLATGSFMKVDPERD